MRLSEHHGWMLLRIAKGRGHPVSIPRVSEHAGEILEELEEWGLIYVTSDKLEFRASILRPGKDELVLWKEREVEEATLRIGARGAEA